MKHFLVSLLVGFWLLGPHAFGAVNARNGVTISTSSTINGRTPNSAINGQTIVSGGSAAWVYVNVGSTADFGGQEVYYTRTPIVANQTGSCTKLAVWVVYRNAGTNFKIALYDSSRNLLTSETVNASSASDSAYFEVTLGTPQSVTASTTYNIATIVDGDAFRFGKDTTPDSESFADFSETYAGFPPNPGPVGSALGTGMRVGMYIVP